MKSSLAGSITAIVFVLLLMSAFPFLEGLVRSLSKIVFFLLAICLAIVANNREEKTFVLFSLILYLLVVIFHIIFDKPIPDTYNPYPTVYFVLHLVGGLLFYFIGKQRLINEDTLLKVAKCCLFVFSLSTILTSFLDSEFAYQTGSYTIMWLMPFCLLKIPKFSCINSVMLLLFFGALAILITGKRTPLLAPVLGGLLAYWMWTNFSIKSLVKFVITTMVILLLVYIIASDSINAQIQRWNDDIAITEEYGSYGNGRSSIWILLLNDFYESSRNEQIFGQGFQSTKTKTGVLWGADIGAHNDYIDTLVNYGYFGLTFHIVFSLGMLIYAIQAIRRHKEQSYILLMIVIMWIISELVSSNNVRLSSILYMMLYFYILGKHKSNKLKIIRE